jgi:hypothetical protein
VIGNLCNLCHGGEEYREEERRKSEGGGKRSSLTVGTENLQAHKLEFVTFVAHYNQNSLNGFSTAMK